MRHAGRLDANRGSEWVIWRPVPDVSGVDDLVVCNEGLSLGVMCGDDAAQFALLRGDCVNRLSRFRAGRRTLSCDQTNCGRHSADSRELEQSAASLIHGFTAHPQSCAACCPPSPSAIAGRCVLELVSRDADREVAPLGDHAIPQAENSDAAPVDLTRR